MKSIEQTNYYLAMLRLGEVLEVVEESLSLAETLREPEAADMVSLAKGMVLNALTIINEIK
jgi:hypothetical protein